MTSLFGEEFEININKPKVKELVKKVKVIKPSEEVDAEKVLKSKSVDIKDKLDVITAKVIATLGKQRANTICIRDRASFTKYIDSAIEAGEIAIDTETNNSLDPVTCKLMGPCLYVPGQKQVYIPINHINVDTKELLPDQLTEQDCKEEFQRLLDNNVKIIMHNGKFDYEVIKCTCGIALPPYWDTMVGARLLNENELAGLKSQYVSKIDPSQAKYDIENLFDKMPYAIVDPDIFALYAATDSMMTYKLYQLQKEELDKDEYSEHLDLTGLHTVKGLRWVFHNIEMPIVVVTAEMELRGVKIDTEFGKRLQDKYNAQLNKIDANINTILDELKPIIQVWRDSKKANEKSKIFVPKKTSKSAEKIEAEYTETDEKTGQKFKWGKSPAEILEENINLASPAQLAVLFYDVLEAPRAQADSNKTGKDELKSIKEKLASYLEEKEDIDLVDSEDLETEVEQADAISEDKILKVKLKAAAKLADAILARRAVAKILTTYVEVIPELVKHWPDGRIRFHLNSLGTDTGRYSSGGKLKFIENDEPVVVSGINIQNIPSHNPEIRMLFTAEEKYHKVDLSDDYYVVPETDEVETSKDWKKVKELVVGDIIKGDDSEDVIKQIIKQDNKFLLYI